MILKKIVTNSYKELQEVTKGCWLVTYSNQW